LWRPNTFSNACEHSPPAFSYDSLDRVTTRTTGGTATAFFYAGVEKDPVAEGTTTKYLRGPDGQSVHGIIRAGTLTFAGADRHGDVSFTLSTTGAIVDSKVRDPYGKTLGSTGTATNIGFQSDWTDPTNGLVRMGARWYNPQTARFTSRDTYPGEIGAYATLNRYTYGLNNPLKYTDPDGHVNADLMVSAPELSSRCLGSSPELSRRWSPELSRSLGVLMGGGLGVRVVGSLTY
jgi:RHS repeat-associated protein